MFFSGAEDVVPVVKHLLTEESQFFLKPRKYFADKFGRLKSGVRLQAFLELIVGEQAMQRAKLLLTKSNSGGKD